MNSTTDWYDIESFNERDYRLVEASQTLPCNMFLIRGDETALLIDSGLGIGNLRGAVGQLIDTEVILLLTHTHWDHIGAGHQFDNVLVHPVERTRDGRVTIDSLSDEFVERPQQFVAEHAQASESFPDDFRPENYTVPPITDVEAIEPGDRVNLGDRTLEIVSISGHSPGQIGVLDAEAGVFYGGDIIHIEQNVYIHFEDCSISDYIDSFTRLVDLGDEGIFDTLATGHNPPISGPDLDILEDLRDGLTAILNGDRESEVVETPWGPANKYEISGSDVLTKTSV